MAPKRKIPGAHRVLCVLLQETNRNNKRTTLTEDFPFDCSGCAQNHNFFNKRPIKVMNNERWAQQMARPPQTLWLLSRCQFWGSARDNVFQNTRPHANVVEEKWCNSHLSEEHYCKRWAVLEYRFQEDTQRHSSAPGVPGLSVCPHGALRLGDKWPSEIHPLTSSAHRFSCTLTQLSNQPITRQRLNVFRRRGVVTVSSKFKPSLRMGNKADLSSLMDLRNQLFDNHWCWKPERYVPSSH